MRTVVLIAVFQNIGRQVITTYLKLILYEMCIALVVKLVFNASGFQF